MAAAGVVSDSVTLCAAVNVPAPGENVGAAAGGRLMVNVPEATALVLNPLATAIALIVVVVPTLMAAVYFDEEVVGVDPSSV